MNKHYDNLKELIPDTYNINNIVNLIVISRYGKEVLYLDVLSIVVNYCKLYNLFCYIENNMIKIKQYD